MRINKFVAMATGISRRAADSLVGHGEVLVNGQPPSSGQDVQDADTVTHQGRHLRLSRVQTIMLHKPIGYVVSRDGQGSKTVYDLLPPELQRLKPVGRLDKFSSGLLLLTNDGVLAQQLTHPRHRKQKVYEVKLSRPLQPLHRQMISDHGIQLEDGPSRFALERLHDSDRTGDSGGNHAGNDREWRVIMREGRNRQIRRTFLALGYGVSRLHRVQFGDYRLGRLKAGGYSICSQHQP